MESGIYSINSICEDEDWDIVCIGSIEGEPENDFHFVNFEDIEAEDTCKGDEEVRERRSQGVEEVIGRQGVSPQGDSNERGAITKQLLKRGKRKRKRSSISKKLTFKEDYFADSQRENEKLQTVPEVAPEESNIQHDVDEEPKIKKEEEQEESPPFCEDEIQALLEDEIAERKAIGNKLEASDKFWYQYEHWDSNPSVHYRQRKFKFLKKLYPNKFKRNALYYQRKNCVYA